MKIFIIATFLLDFIAILLIVLEDVLYEKFEKFLYTLFTFFVPILGALVVMYKFGGKGKASSNSNGVSIDYPPSYSSGDSFGGGE